MSYGLIELIRTAGCAVAYDPRLHARANGFQVALNHPLAGARGLLVFPERVLDDAIGEGLLVKSAEHGCTVYRVAP